MVNSESATTPYGNTEKRQSENCEGQGVYNSVTEILPLVTCGSVTLTELSASDIYRAL